MRPDLSRPLPSAHTLFVLALTALALLVLAACTGQTDTNFTGDAQPPGFFPGEVVTKGGRNAANLYAPIFVIATIVFILVEGLIILIAWRYHRRPTDTGLPRQVHGNNRLELLWTIVPAITVTVLFIGTFITLAETEASDPNPAVTIDVRGFQWQWTFEYPEYTNASGRPLSYTGAGKIGPELVLPVGEIVRFNLHSQDVIHSFYVPQFFYKKDVIPGRVNTFDVTVDQVGTYGGQCAEFCGLGHADMFFTVRAVSSAEFQIWVAEEQQKAAATRPPPPSNAATIEVTSVGIVQGFDPDTLTAPADTPITIQLINADTSAPHDVSIRGATPDGSDWIGKPPAPPSGTATYQAPPLGAGSYQFFCSIHANMVGTLTVGP